MAIADIHTSAQSQIQCFSNNTVRMCNGCDVSALVNVDRLRPRSERKGRTWMRMRYVPIARHKVQMCSVHSTAMSTNPRPSHVAVPATSRWPGMISMTLPMSPTMLSMSVPLL